jgi:CRISPR-associated protein Csd2
MRDLYWDVRMFGAVLTAGTNAGQIRGPMQLTFATSVDPVVPRDISITRVAITKASDMLRKQTEMGRKGYVPYGLYRLHGFYSPLLGVRAGGAGKPSQVVNEPDLVDFWESLEKMFEFDRSAARGEMSCRGIYIFTHENPKGDAAAHRLFELVQTRARGDSTARAFSDYSGKILSPPEGALAAHPGVTLTVLARVEHVQ